VSEETSEQAMSTREQVSDAERECICTARIYTEGAKYTGDHHEKHCPMYREIDTSEHIREANN
jgi:hypothetical protein